MKLIAETAWHHEGDFNFLRNLSEKVITECEPDYIKYHITIDFDEYMSKDHDLYDRLSGMTFSQDQWSQILQISNSNTKAILLFNDVKAVEFGMSYNPEIVEIHSACLNDIRLLDALKSNILKTTKVMFGVGGSTLYEIEKAIERVRSENIILMHGFQNYPTQYGNINFAKTKKIMGLYPGYQHGYADHTGWNEPDNMLITLMGAAMGMDYIEKHITLEYGKERIDYSSSISIDMFNELKSKLHILSECYGNGLLEMNDGEKRYSQFGPIKKAAYLSSDVKKGEQLSEDKIKFIRTSRITNLSQIDVLNLLGEKFNNNYHSNIVITKEMFTK